jgi:hypothetical protein
MRTSVDTGKNRRAPDPFVRSAKTPPHVRRLHNLMPSDVLAIVAQGARFGQRPVEREAGSTAMIHHRAARFPFPLSRA